MEARVSQTSISLVINVCYVRSPSLKSVVTKV